MVSKLFLTVFALIFIASAVVAYYPYRPEYRIYGTDDYLRTAPYDVYYTNYSPVNYSVYSGPYAGYTGYYYEPAYYAEPSYSVYYGGYYGGYGSYYSGYNSGYYASTGVYYRPAVFETPSYTIVEPAYYTGSYYRPYYYRDYPEATAYVTYNTSPTSFVTSYNYSGYSPVYTGYGTYTGYHSCTESWCVRLS